MNRFFLPAAAALAASIAAPAAAQFTDVGNDLVSAVRSGDGGKLQNLVNDNPKGIVNARDNLGETGLIVALGKRDVDFTAYLLQKGADPNLAGTKGDTPLIVASRVGFTDAIGWLLGLGAKVNAANRAGETPLILAVQGRQAAIVRRLLEAGADPDRSDNVAGFSARDYASRDPRARDILKLIETSKPKP